MRRVSSRQRLVSWDAFDASAPDYSSSSDNDEDDDNMSGYLTATAYDPVSPSPSSRRTSLAMGTFDLQDDDVNGGMFDLDIEEDDAGAASRTAGPVMAAASTAPAPSSSASAASTAGTKRDRSGAAAEGHHFHGGNGGGMKKSVSFSRFPAPDADATATTPANSAPPSAPATPARPSPPLVFAEDGLMMPHPQHDQQVSTTTTTMPQFPRLADPAVPVVEPEVGEGGDDDDYGHMPALSAIAAVLKSKQQAADSSASPVLPEDDDDDDYGKLPVVSSAAAAAARRAAQEHEEPSLPLVAAEDDDDDDYGKLPVVLSGSSLAKAAKQKEEEETAEAEEEPLVPDEDEDGDDYGKSPVLAAAAAALSRIPPLSPAALGAAEDDDDDYGKMPSSSSSASSSSAVVAAAAAPRPIPRNESEMSLGLRYMTPLPSSADLRSLESSPGQQCCSSLLGRALNLHGPQDAYTSLSSAAAMAQSSQAQVQALARRGGGPTLTSLPDDALLRVLSCLPPYDIRRASESCRSVRRAVVAGEAGRYLWAGMMRDRWPLLGRIASAGRMPLEGGEMEGDGNGMRFVDGAGVSTAGLGLEEPNERHNGGEGENDPNLSVLLGMSALRSPSRVDPYYHAPTSHRTVEFRSFDLDTSASAPGDVTATPIEANDSPTALEEERDQIDRRRAESRRRAQSLLAEAGTVPVVQFTGRVGSGDRCVRSDAPLARPSPLAAKAKAPSSSASSSGASGASGGGSQHGADHAEQGSGGGGGAIGFHVGSPALSSSPTARMMEFLRRGRAMCGSAAGLGGGTSPRPFVTPFVTRSPASENGAAVVVDLTPRLVSYFEVSILKRDEAREPPMHSASSSHSHGSHEHSAVAAGRAAAAQIHPQVHPPAPAGVVPAAATLPRRPLPHPGQIIPTVHFHHPLMPLPLPIPGPPVPHPRRLPLPRRIPGAAPAGVGPGAGAGAGAGFGAGNDGGAAAGRDGAASTNNDCVAVGLSTRSFLAHRRMPGWDRHSYGYHGDDGGVFHSSGEMERIFGPTYGPGDTVGCGVDYLNGGIFFTLNGEFLGYAWTGLKELSVPTSGSSTQSSSEGGAADGGGPVELYPTVGVDSTCPVACNFGEREFAFDLGTFVREGRHGEAVRRSLGGLVRGEEKRKDDKEDDDAGGDGGCDGEPDRCATSSDMTSRNMATA